MRQVGAVGWFAAGAAAALAGTSVLAYARFAPALSIGAAARRATRDTSSGGVPSAR